MAYCRQCGAKIGDSDDRFCRTCGHPVGSAEVEPAPAPPSAAVGGTEPSAWSAPRLTPGQLVSVTLACLAVCLIGWLPLSLPSLTLNAVAGNLGLWKACGEFRVGSAEMFACSAVVGLTTVAIGPLLITVLLYVFRSQLAAGLRRVLRRWPSTQLLTAPIVATAVFLVGWSGTHFATPYLLGFGFLPNLLFPAVVGLLTYVLIVLAGPLQRTARVFFSLRDIVPGVLRLVATIALTAALAASWSIQRSPGGGDVRDPTTLQQSIVIVGLLIGFVLLTPSRGDPIQAGRRALLRHDARS
jgi:hypothetical protein